MVAACKDRVPTATGHRPKMQSADVTLAFESSLRQQLEKLAFRGMTASNTCTVAEQHGDLLWELMSTEQPGSW